MSNRVVVNPNSSPTLLTLHLHPSKYYTVARECERLARKCFPGIAFDPSARTIHFKQGIETVQIALASSIEDLAQYRFEKGRPFTATEKGILSDYSTNGTRWEFHTEAPEAFQLEAEKFFRARPARDFISEFRASGNEMGQFLAEVSEQTHLTVQPTPEQERVSVAMLEGIHRLLSNHSLEELHQMADRLQVERSSINLDCGDFPRIGRVIAWDAAKRIQYKGTEDEYIAFRLREKGSLTPERLPRLQAINEKRLRVLNGRAVIQQTLERPTNANSIRATLQDLLTHHRGIAFGEVHKESDILDILTENMQFLSNLGVKTLFVEHLIDTIQPLIDAYLAQKGKHAVMPKLLKETLKSLDKMRGQQHSKCSFIDFLQAARRANIRVVALETEVTEHCGVVDKNTACYSSQTRRCNTFNYSALSKIQSYRDDNPDDKFIVYAGGAHILDLKNYAPGFASLLGIPCIGAGAIQKEVLASKIKTSEIIRKYDVFFNPEEPPIQEQQQSVRNIPLALRAIKKKIHNTRTKLHDLERLASKTSKAARHRKNTVHTRHSHLQARLHTLQQQKDAILRS